MIVFASFYETSGCEYNWKPTRDLALINSNI